MQTFLLPKIERGPERDLARGQLDFLLRSLSPKFGWTVEVKRYVKERTSPQNKALWGCAYKALHEATGNDKDDLHEFFCGEYWGWDVRQVMGSRKKVPKRTTTTGYDGKTDVIDTIELSTFYDFIQRRAAEEGYSVPNPDPRWWQKKPLAA